MKLVSVETPEKSVCKMTFSATAEELETASNAVYERTRANYTIKGFEKGEADRARALWQRRFGQPPRSPADFARQFRFLVGRGFAPDVVQRLLRQALKDAGGVIDPA